MNYYLKAIKNYATFRGRATESEYWYFVLFNMIFYVVTAALDLIIDTNYLISALYNLALVIPGLAISVRRLHDVGKSGWFLLIPIYSFILILTDGNKSTNEYGEAPNMFRKKDRQEYDEIHKIILSLLIAAFSACFSYALLNETKIIAAYQKAETIKTIIAVIVFLMIFILSAKLNHNQAKDTRVRKI